MHTIVVIGASRGGLEPLKEIIAALPMTCTAAVFIVQHVDRHVHFLPEILGKLTQLPVLHPMDGDGIEAGIVYVAPVGLHMLVEMGVVRLSSELADHNTRPAVDPLFFSAAEAYGGQVIGIILTGGDDDGARGLTRITELGGLSIVQDPVEATVPNMPLAALFDDHPAMCLPMAAIASKVRELCTPALAKQKA